MWAPSAFEAALLYREIVTERTYQSHGITIPDGAVIFDVGANVGLFALHLARTIPGARIHAFEPIPELFEALTRNLAEHAPQARARNVALADRDGSAVFTFDRFMTLGTTMHPAVFATGADRQASTSAWIAAAIADVHKVTPGGMTRVVSAALQHPAGRVGVLAAALPILAALRVRQWIFLKRHRCRLQTLSAALAESDVDAVDLVKIDVEGAEEEVLDGIAAHDWPRLRQLVIEVHDIDGRLARLGRLLESHGYRTVHAREDWALHALLGISTLYAIRP